MGPLSEWLREFTEFIARAAKPIVGRIAWQPPKWIASAGQRLAVARQWLLADRWRWITLVSMLVLLTAGTYWYKHRPVPNYAGYTVAAPALTEFDENGNATIHPLEVEFSEAAAPLQQIEKVVTAGIAISPAIPGKWFWLTDRKLQFTPRNDWPVDGAFSVQMDKKRFLAKDVLLEDYSFDFRSAAFTAKLLESRFYQDPRNPNLKKVVSTVQFSHPVDTQAFETRVSLEAAADAQYLGLKPDSSHFTVAYDKFKLQASIHSAALEMPRDDTKMTVRVGKGIRAARGGNTTKEELSATVTVPGRTSLKFSGAFMTVVDNARYEPEQILMLNSSSPVAERSFTAKVAACVLPERHPRQPPEQLEPYRWDDPAQVGNEVLPKCSAMPLTYVAAETAGETSHGFKFRGPVGRYVFLLVQAGVDGTGGYISGKPYAATFVIQPYPQKLTFLGSGSLLSLSGDKKLGFLARDVDRVQIEVARVLPGQVQHLAPIMGNYQHPNVWPNVQDQIAERFLTVRDYSGKAPGKPTYDSIDLGQYLRAGGQNRGLFVVRVRSAPPKEDSSDQENDDDGSAAGPNDARLVLVTDLGFIVKRAKDGGRDVFVQSIRTGLPVEGTRVELSGANGQPIAAATTDGNGRAQLPPVDLRHARREKNPLMIVAQKDGDFSFMPLDMYRGLDLSRFDTGGVENAGSSQQLGAYLFSDRGIYRPGETAHLGLIVRTADWKGNVAGLPVELEITDPRGSLVSSTPVKLSTMAFDEVPYTSQVSSPTGIYQASALLVKDARHKEIIGTTTFKVQEFEPDRMKVRLDLSEKPIEGWLKPGDVKARATVAHLFGDPATGRRVEGELSLTAVLPRFAKYPEYRFQTGEVLTEPFREALKPAVTDDKGVAEFQIDLTRFVGRAYRLNLLTRAFEAEGGRNVAAQNSAIISEAAYLVGVKGDGDMGFVSRGSARQAHWLAVNQELIPVAAENLSLDWVQRKYVSVLTQQYDKTFRYVSRLKETVRNTRKVRIAPGGSNIPLPTTEPGDFVLVLRDTNGAELNKLNYSVAGDANLSAALDKNAELQVRLDKPAYAAGDTISVSIRAPYIGAGLITIERDRVFQSQWFKTSTTSTVQKIQLPKDFEGNGYVSVQFVRDPSSDEIFVSPLSYGVAPFAADLTARTQSVSLTAQKEVKPGTNLSIRVVPGEASRVAVLAVDEGILQVGRYKNPDPLGYFFQKKMLEVDTSQILDLILPEFKKFLSLAAPGGDADGGFARHLNPFGKKRKPPVAWWSGVVDVGPGGQTFQYNVPDYFNGRIRLVAIAVNSRKVGVAETGTDVKGNFILTPNVPNMVAPGDEFTVSVGVFNNLPGNGPVHVELQAGRELAMQGASGVDLQVASKKEGTAEFRLKANAVLGSASMKFVARRGNAEAHLEESVSVRPAVAYRTQVTLGTFDRASTSVPLTRDLYAENRQVDAAVSSVPLVWGQGLVAWLGDYPYSCTEQLVSKGVAAMIIASRPEFGTVRTKEGQPLAAVFSTLQSRANDQGGFGLWASSPVTAEVPTVYAAQFLVEAQERGVRMPNGLLGNTNNWLMRFAGTPASSLEGLRQRAQAVYLLARQGINPRALLANVEQEAKNRYGKVWQHDLAAAYVASTYRLLQRSADADRTIQDIPWAQQKQDWGDEVYYGAAIHDSQLLYLTARHFPNRIGAIPSAPLQGIAAAVSGGQVTSISAAYALYALDAYAKAVGAAGKFGIGQIGKDGVDRGFPLPAGSMPKVSVPAGAARLRFSKEGSVVGYYAVNESGFDRNPPAPMSQGIEIIREFADMNGNPLTQAKVGQEFLIRLRLRATKKDKVEQVAVVDLLPGGVESVLELQPVADSSSPGADPAAAQRTGFSALPIGVAAKSNWVPEHVDVRDDRLVLYGTVGRDAGTFSYRVRATNPGLFQAPPAFAEGMYDRKVSGVGTAGRLEIVRP